MREFKFQIKALATCIFSFLLVCSGCKQIPEGIVPIEDVIVEKYAGTWYEIERLDNRFEKHLSRVTATYNLEDDGMIEVVNRLKGGEQQYKVKQTTNLEVLQEIRDILKDDHSPSPSDDFPKTIDQLTKSGMKIQMRTDRKPR